MGMASAQPSIMTQLQSNCCTATGVTCTATRVTHIIWKNLNLNGIINTTAYPPQLTWFEMNYNALTGNLPNVYPPNLNFLHLGWNLFNGSIPTITQSSITDIDFAGSYLSGQHPSQWPPGITWLDTSFNLMTGTLPIQPLLGLQYFHMGYNSVSGAMPVTITSKDVWFGYNYFTGSLTITNPVAITICNNFITSITVQDTSALGGNCDLSNNPLLGSSSITNLAACTQNNLYAVSQLAAKTSSPDCPNVILLAMGLNMNATYPALVAQMKINCCLSLGMTCALNKVTQIDWSGLQLTGTLEGKYLPNALISLILSNNLITGQMPNCLPSTLQTLDVSGGNKMTGSVILNMPIYLKLSGNLVTDVVVGSAAALTTCHLSLNPLLGNPRVAALSMCTKTGLYALASSLVPVQTQCWVSATSAVVTTRVLVTTRVTSAVTSAVVTTSVVTTRVLVTSAVTSAFTTTSKVVGTTEIQTTDVPFTTDVLTTADVPITTAITSNVPITNATRNAILKSPTLDAYLRTPISATIVVSLFGVFRMIVDMMVLAYVLVKTPFTNKQREMIRSNESKRSSLASRNSRAESRVSYAGGF